MSDRTSGAYSKIDYKQQNMDLHSAHIPEAPCVNKQIILSFFDTVS